MGYRDIEGMLEEIIKKKWIKKILPNEVFDGSLMKR